MSQLQMRNPQMFQAISQAKNNGTNPQAMLKQILSGTNPQQMQSIMQQAKSMGCPDEILKQIQNIK